MESINTTGIILPAETLEKISGLETILIGIIGFYIFLRLLSIIRVTRDIHARTNSMILQLTAIIFATILSPIFSIPIYITMRPVQYKSKQ